MIDKLFPEIKKWDLTADGQLEKLTEELNELKKAHGSGDRASACEEAVDIMHAAVQYMYCRGYDSHMVYAMIECVEGKNRRRGYYDERDI